MDIAGPWEVFGDAMLTSKGKPWHEADGDDMMMPFNTYTVSDSLKPVNAANGLIIVPNYSFETAPKTTGHRRSGAGRPQRRPESMVAVQFGDGRRHHVGLHRRLDARQIWPA